MKIVKYILYCIIGCFDALVGKGVNHSASLASRLGVVTGIPSLQKLINK